jgi:hypothetical protein
MKLKLKLTGIRLFFKDIFDLLLKPLYSDEAFQEKVKVKLELEEAVRVKIIH